MLWCADRYAVHRCFMFQPLIINNHRCFYRSRESHKHNGANKEWAIKIFPIKTVHFCCLLFLFVRLVLSTLSVISKIHRWTVMWTFVFPVFPLVRFAKKIVSSFEWLAFCPLSCQKTIDDRIKIRKIMRNSNCPNVLVVFLPTLSALFCVCTGWVVNIPLIRIYFFDVMTVRNCDAHTKNFFWLWKWFCFLFSNKCKNNCVFSFRLNGTTFVLVFFALWPLFYECYFYHECWSICDATRWMAWSISLFSWNAQFPLHLRSMSWSTFIGSSAKGESNVMSHSDRLWTWLMVLSLEW